MQYVQYIIVCFVFFAKILIELETALLDDQPHWYKLQTHDVSSLPLPQPSPYLPRRHIHTDSPSKKLQSEYHVCVYIHIYIYSIQHTKLHSLNIADYKVISI